MSSTASSSASPALPDVEMTSATSTASASPHSLPGQYRQLTHGTTRTRLTWIAECPLCLCVRPRTHLRLSPSPGLLAVCALLCCRMQPSCMLQVEREDAQGDVKVEQGESLADVVERAVEKERIESIRWKDVAGWELWDSRAKAKRLHSGTSQRAAVGPSATSQSKSLLVLTRRRRASQQQPILPRLLPSPPSSPPLPLPTSSSITRLSWPLKDKHSMPACCE